MKAEKVLYQAPVASVLVFDAKDILTVSNNETEPDVNI